MGSVRRRSANESDRQLLRASRDGAGGFDAFSRRHREVVLAYLAQRVREPELAAEEIANDVDVIERLASQLPSAQFDALQARVVDEREYVDIARELECSEAVVRMRVSRALSTLRAASEGRHE
jgi:DNA-directed RNA polymerase specialized sigma24 family protein